MIAPGFVETDLVDQLFNDPVKKKELLKQIPIRRFTKPEEVSQAVLFLIRRKPQLIGVTIPVGGGGHLI